MIMAARMVIVVALGLYLSLADCVLSGSLTETSPDTAVALEDSHALGEGSSRMSWSPSRDSLERQELDRFRTPNPSGAARRSLRGRGKGGSKAKKSKIVGISIAVGGAVVLGVFARCWCWHKRKNDPNWKVSDAFRR